MGKSNKRRFIFIISIILSQSQLFGQTGQLRKTAFLTDSVGLFFENNFIEVDDKNVTAAKNQVEMPFNDFRYSVYGPQLKIQLYKIRELFDKGGGFSFSMAYEDKSSKDRPLFNLDRLEYRVVLNTTTVTPWLPVKEAAPLRETTPYLDTMNVQIDRNEVKGKLFQRNGLLLSTIDNLLNGDSVRISFRSAQQRPFLNFHFTKKNPALTPPLLIAILYDSSTQSSLEKFAESAYKFSLTADLNPYQNLPGHSQPGNDRLFESSKLALFFYPDTTSDKDRSFEYRLQTNGTAAPWKPTDNIIYIYDLKAGNKYLLEVRKIRHPEFVFQYKFFVPAKWYQTGWFKLFVLLLLAIAGIFIFLLLKLRQRKLQHRDRINKLSTLSAQLNPHFVFNALGSIQGLLNSGDTDSANRYLSGFATLLRNVLDSTKKQMISLEDEVKNIRNYIQLEKLRKDFTFIEQIPANMQLPEIEMLPFLFQPLIENAIKHGFGRQEGMSILFSIEKNNHDLTIRIEDNGKGFDTQRKYSGKGLRLTKARIDLFNLTSKSRKIVQQISSGKEGSRFCFTFIDWLYND